LQLNFSGISFIPLGFICWILVFAFDLSALLISFLAIDYLWKGQLLLVLFWRACVSMDPCISVSLYLTARCKFVLAALMFAKAEMENFCTYCFVF